MLQTSSQKISNWVKNTDVGAFHFPQIAKMFLKILRKQLESLIKSGGGKSNLPFKMRPGTCIRMSARPSVRQSVCNAFFKNKANQHS